MRSRIQHLLIRLARKLQPKPPLPDPTLLTLTAENNALRAEAHERDMWGSYLERCAELIEARNMAGSGPWLVAEARADVDGPAKLREANPLISQGAFGDIELALQNVEWRREINLSWLEFSRWGIQQIILISRLYYEKNPIIRRLVDVCAAYVFARGVDISADDPDANEILVEFMARNKKVLGQKALVHLERTKDLDGNLFFAFFADAADTGQVDVRTIDATEVMDIVTDPDDVDTECLFRRVWVQRIFVDGATSTKQREAWYPALGYDPAEKPESINGVPVEWNVPVLHEKVGHVGKWLFGCPRVYPMLDWAREAKRFLEACASIRQSLSQFAMTLTTKGGQQALEAQKQQLQTSVGPNASLWDTNPPAVAGSIFGSGPGTKLEAFKTQGAGFDPEGVRQYKLMCAMVAGVPETFLADVSTGNLATATSLDRPTETIMLEKQEAWSETLVTIAQYVLDVSRRAPGGKLREAIIERRVDPGSVRIIECERKFLENGHWVYDEAKKNQHADEIKVLATFPAIREGDMAANVAAIVQAMTLNNRGGQIVGIDEKVGIKELYKNIGVDNGEEEAEKQYPTKEYDPDRTKEVLPLPIGKLPPQQGGVQPAPDEVRSALADEKVPPSEQEESLVRATARLENAIGLLEGKRNGRATHHRA